MSEYVKGPNDIDKHVGQRVKDRRKSLGMTQAALAIVLGVTCQQIQKYENGNNRISAGRLYELAHALEVSVNYFYEHLTDYTTDIISYQIKEDSDPLRDKYLFTQESFDLLRAYYGIKNERVRRNIIQLCHSFGEIGSGDTDEGGSDL